MRDFYSILESTSDGITLNKVRSHPDEIPIVRKTVDDLHVAYRPYEGRCEDMVRFLESFRSCIADAVCGDGICLYEKAQDGSGIRMTCCFPVRREMLNDSAAMTVLQGGVTVSMEHVQGMKALGKSWERLFDFIEARNIPVCGARREVYRGLRDPSTTFPVVELQVPVDMSSMARIASR